jgi:hypothetical protein
MLDNVKMFSISNLAAENTSLAIDFYESNSLFASVSIDENGNRSTELKDLDGRILCKRVQHQANDFIETNYVYDDLGQLRFVFQPLATALLSGSVTPLTNPALKELTFGCFRGWSPTQCY